MNATFLPAIVPDVLRNRWVRTPTHWMDIRLRGTAAYHPAALVSYPFWRGQPSTWAPINFVFGDSGGFSVKSRNLGIDPAKVIWWQLHHCRVGVLLDMPPGTQGRSWQECLARTVADMEVALPHYLDALEAGTEFRWWGVVHGQTPEVRAAWWEAIRRVYPFHAPGEGWALKPAPHVEAVAEALDFLQERGIRRAHFFARTDQLTVETLLTLGPGSGLEFMTVDSATPVKYGNNRVLAVPTPYGWRTMRGVARTHLLACRCVSCGYLRQDLAEAPAEQLDDGYWVQRLKFHNVLVMLRRFEELRRRHCAFPERASNGVKEGRNTVGQLANDP
jgi:hypothetical protein